MRILYVASDQVVPGRTGGSVHVLEVASGLAARGHDVHALVWRPDGALVDERFDGVTWHRLRWFPGSRFFRWRATAQVKALLAAVQPQVVMERYYNFGGEGVCAAAAAGLPSLLEVNAPVVDHPGSKKAMLDRALVVRPLQRRREKLCALSGALVSPLREIVPAAAQHKTEVVTWGANVDAFRPERRSDAVRRELGIPEGATAVLFSGSFRPWHGVHVLEEAARRLQSRADLYFVLVGGDTAGPGDGWRGVRTGALAYARMPEIVASCDIGTAPYDTARLGQLRLGFFWSPLKIFEYMACGLPTLTVPLPPLSDIVRDGEEGLLVAEADPAALADAILRLTDDAALRQRMGASARERVVARYSWARHCEQLEAVLQRLTGTR